METTSRDSPFFSAFQPAPKRSRRWILPVLLAVLVLTALSAWLVRPNPQHYTVVTPRGLRLVSLGMSEHEVGSLLGRPISSRQIGNQVCLRYGTPSLKVPSFLLYDACFEGGTLRSFTPRRFSAEAVEPAQR